MPRALIQNNGTTAITLPLPYTGLVPAKSAVVVDDSAAYVVDRIMNTSPSIATVLSVRDVPLDQKVDGHTRTMAASKITDALAVTATSLSMNSQRIVNVADPISPTDVATKQYVDAHSGGGGGGGTVTSITAGAGLTGGTITLSGTIAVDFGTVSGKVADGGDSRFNPAPSVAGAVLYDNGSVYTKTAAGTPGQVLKVGSGGLPEWGADGTTPTGPAGGSLAGTYPNPTIAAGAITNTEVAAGAGILTSKLSGLVTDIVGNGLTSFLSASSKVARTYYVAVNGSDSTGNGSVTAPFASIQQALTQAGADYPSNEMVLISVGPGTFSGNVNITRYNTLIQGQGHRAEMFATSVQGSITVNPLTATQKFNHLVGLAGMFIQGSGTGPAVKATGSGLYQLILNDCYLYTNNAAATASAFACDATNLQRPRLVANDCIMATEAAGPNIVQLDQGDARFLNTRIQHNSGVTPGSAGIGIVVANAATLWLDHCLVETVTTGAGIQATGASATAKLTSTYSAVNTYYSGAADTSHGVLVNNTTGVAAFLYDTSFYVADTSAAVYAINGSAPAVVVYGQLSFQPGTNSAIAPSVTLTPMVEKHATLNLPSLSGAAYPIPLQLDANKNVVAQAISMSNLSGTLPVDKGGTGINTIAANGSVAYSNGSTLAYSDVGTTGYPLLSQGSGKPIFAALDLGTSAVTGSLSASRQAAQTMGGDVTGTTAASTVAKIQSRDVSATAPTSGQALVWSGSAWEPATISAGGGGGGGSGGLTFYMNWVAGDAPVPAIGDKELSLTFNAAIGQQNTGAVTAPQGTYATLAEFVTDLNQPGATTIAPGNWDFAVYLNLATGANNTFFRVRLYKWDGTTLTELSTSPSDNVAIASTVNPTQYTASLYVEQAVLTATDRLVVRLEITRSVAANREVTGYFNGNTPSHIHSTLGAPGGTGLVKVAAGIVQSPATLLVNADVDSAAAIAVSKLELGTANTVLRGGAVSNSFGKVQLGSDVDGQLPINNGGTGLQSGTSGGVLYFSNTTTLASSDVLAQYALVTGGGAGAAPSTLSSLGTTTTVLHGNASGVPTWAAITLTSDVTGTLPILNGGTNATAIGAAGTVAYSTGSAYDFSAAGTAGQILTSGGMGAPAWVTTLPIANGGTNSSAVPTAGAVAYGTGTAYAFSLAGNAGQVLTSGGSAAPTWTTLTLASLSGTLPILNGGTNATSIGDAGTVAYSTGTAYAFSAAGAAGQILTSTGAAAPAWVTTLPIANGGTGGSSTPTLNGVSYGDGSKYLFTAAGTANQVLRVSSSGAPEWGDVPAVPYDLAGSVPGKPDSLAVVFLFVATRAFTLSSTGTDHLFRALTQADGSSIFTVYRTAAIGGGKTAIGTATFSAGQTACTLTNPSVTSIAVGDYITIEAPITPDATLKDIFWTLKGSA